MNDQLFENGKTDRVSQRRSRCYFNGLARENGRVPKRAPFSIAKSLILQRERKNGRLPHLRWGSSPPFSTPPKMGDDREVVQ